MDFLCRIPSHIVGYLTLDSDLDLAPGTDQFVAFPPVKYINSRCCVKISQKFSKANNIFALHP